MRKVAPSTQYRWNERTGELDIDPRHLAAGVERAEAEKVSAIRIVPLGRESKQYKLDFSPLRGNTSITALDVERENYAPDNIDALYSMDALRKLSVWQLGIDLSKMPQLTSLTVHLDKNTFGLAQLQRLRELQVTNLPGNDCTELACLPMLTDLRISSGGLERLNGLENLPDLRSVALRHCPRLVDASAMAFVLGLESLHVENCNLLWDFSFLASHPSLRSLFMAQVESLAFVPSIPQLADLSFWNCKDGDISPVLRCKSLQKAWFAPDKRHYNLTNKVLQARLQSRN